MTESLPQSAVQAYIYIVGHSAGVVIPSPIYKLSAGISAVCLIKWAAQVGAWEGGEGRGVRVGWHDWGGVRRVRFLRMPETYARRGLTDDCALPALPWLQGLRVQLAVRQSCCYIPGVASPLLAC